MKTLDQVREFYETKLKGVLETLEKERADTLRQTLIVCGVLAAIGLGVGLFFVSGGMPPIILLFILILCAVICGGYYAFETRNYKQGFKMLVIRDLISFVQPELEYIPTDGIGKELFKASGLFTQSVDRYKCEDLVRGTVDKTQMMFSEVHAEYKTTSGTGKNRHTQWHTIFKGLFFMADFNKNFNGRTVVLPDSAQKAFGLFGQTLQSWNMSRDQLVKLEDVEFEREFVVYSTDQIEARYILSPALMERILHFQRAVGKDIHISFLGSKVFVAVDLGNVNMFEPKMFTSAVSFDTIAEYYRQLQFSVGIVDQLNLNTRIWSKE